MLRCNALCRSDPLLSLGILDLRFDGLDSPFAFIFAVMEVVVAVAAASSVVLVVSVVVAVVVVVSSLSGFVSSCVVVVVEVED